ncbi:MAG: triose-phosphate isomerase [Candidatus Methanomethylophilaceae archaeon]
MSGRPISKPAVIINFKAYSEAEGARALEIAKLCEQISEENGVKISICPPMVELSAVAKAVKIPVLSQNVDPHAPGSSTGWVTPSMVRSAGAVGTLINHTEHKVSIDTIEECLELSKGCELVTVVCADTVQAAVKIAHHCPDFIAVEPPDLIGGDISVTSANPQIVESTVESVKSVNGAVSVLCGAGVKTGMDVKTALDLGADGVLLASGVIKAKDQRATLQDLVKYL